MCIKIVFGIINLLMNIRKRENSPRYKRDNIESFLLVSKKTTNSDKLSVTLVEMQPNGFQHVHSHEPEQMYYILEGTGTLTIDNEEMQVQQGDCVYIPSNSKHGLTNTGNKVLKYLSAASPSFTPEECDEFWPLQNLTNKN